MKKPNIVFEDFLKLDVRVGQVKKAEKMEKSEKLIRLKVDFGQEIGFVQILAGLAQYYQPKNLKGKKFLFLVNLEPKKMLGELSNGMLLVANINDKPTIFSISKKLPNGSFLY